jgi:G:T-mismatch repair DNA endonuclease (very short patch repair protein)
MSKQCVECAKIFESKAHKTVTCSQECKAVRKLKLKKESIERRKEKFNCRVCEKEVFRYRKRNGFCSRSCASKHYIGNGVYDTWRFRIQEKTGITKKCCICNQDFYAEPAEVITKKICGQSDCRKKHMSNFMKENSPVRGTKEKPETREKIKKTLMERYGIQNAYELAKHTSLSKPQKEILENLKKNTEYTILCDFPIHTNGKCYKVDILIKEINLIIEFNGTYWHTDPRFYNETYFHKRKKKTAKEIWLTDEERIKNLKNLGYNVKVIWEFDYMQDKQRTLKEILNG